MIFFSTVSIISFLVYFGSHALRVTVPFVQKTCDGMHNPIAKMSPWTGWLCALRIHGVGNLRAGRCSTLKRNFRCFWHLNIPSVLDQKDALSDPSIVLTVNASQRGRSETIAQTPSTSNSTNSLRTNHPSFLDHSVTQAPLACLSPWTCSFE